MDQSSEPEGQDEATPIFSAYRRGYDPEQVDRYVADQRRRLDEALQRGAEAERRLAAAVGQLRELHRRVTVLESEPRPALQPTTSIDVLGDRVQRILQEAWEGAYALRQTVESEAAALRDEAEAQAEEVVESARSKAKAIEEEMRRRRHLYIKRVEEEKSKAVAQLGYLSDQRKTAIEELRQIRESLDLVIGDGGEAGSVKLTLVEQPEPAPVFTEVGDELSSEFGLSHTRERHPAAESAARRRIERDDGPDGEHLAPTMPVHVLPSTDNSARPADTSALVRSHRSAAVTVLPAAGRGTSADDSQVHPSVFDFEADETL